MHPRRLAEAAQVTWDTPRVLEEEGTVESSFPSKGKEVPPEGSVPQSPPLGVGKNVGPLPKGMSHFSKKCKNPDRDVKSPNFK